MKTMQHDWLERVVTAAAIIALPLAAAAHGLPHDATDQCAPAPHMLRAPMPLPPSDMRLDGYAPGGMPLPPYLRDIELSETQPDKLFNLIHAQTPALREKGKAAFKAMEELRRLATADRFDAAQAPILANTRPSAGRPGDDACRDRCASPRTAEAGAAPGDRRHADEGRIAFRMQCQAIMNTVAAPNYHYLGESRLLPETLDYALHIGRRKQQAALAEEELRLAASQSGRNKYMLANC
jgi:Spy/CpxP family protein refolding chaperone